MQHEGRKLNAAGALYVSLTEYTVVDPATPSPLSVDTPGDERRLPVENRFEVALESYQLESGEEERMDETMKPSARLEKRWS